MSKWTLPIIAVAAAIAFVTKPSIEKHKAVVDASFSQARQNSWSSGNLGQWMGIAAIDNLRSADYEDYILASRYKVKLQEKTVIDCFGVLGNVMCSRPSEN
ncbi:hypothetical protein [Sphingomonas sp.]|uniref:hypothetical protein n=1 Tax=Sphingomonas sp. TaxID=28214 RepID=UPI001D3F97FD|nr:hypothetical protein [Sphingomonas sp.]MBX9796240.1 hypothetical protein [Sphingomonas sp.]